MFLFLFFFSFHLIIGGPISLDGIIPLFFALDLSISFDGIKKLYSFCGFLVGCPYS